MGSQWGRDSPRQWGRPFGRAPREICPAISTHPHWGGDCTTTLRWQDVGAMIGVGDQDVSFSSHDQDREWPMISSSEPLSSKFFSKQINRI